MPGNATTTALVHREAKGKSKLETVTLEAIRDDEALVEIHASGICHTDLSCMDGMLPAAFPAVFGHEGAGKVLEVGKNIKNLSVGDKVLLSYAFCQTCDACKAGTQSYCMNFMPLNFAGKRLDGSDTMTVGSGGGDRCSGHFFGQSSFAGKAIAHTSTLVKVPADTPLDLYAPLGCGLQTGAGTILNSLQVKAGSTVAVFGVGSVGLAAVMAAKMAKAGKIIAVDLQPARLELAKKLGATDTVVGSDADLVEQVQKLSPPNGVNYAVDATGVPAVIEKMIQCLGTKGTAASVGAPPPGATVAVDVLGHLLMGRSYIGATEGDSDTQKFIPYLIEEHKKGNFPFEKIVTYYDAKDYQKAFDDMHEGKTVKAILKWT